MYIGKVAKLSGTTVKSIRHYEEIGLIPQPQREGKYRIYSQESIDVLGFIKCAQNLGFKLKELQEILCNYDGREFPWDLAQQAITRKKAELLTQIDTVQALYDGLVAFEQTLEHAKEECHLVRATQHEKQSSARS
ncbi:MAG: MerR family transcriptional regulator [Pseudomonas sp.]|uniref:MerR family transcriptional regulator n=1 Tax=Pseudomonas sp. TaxID=306 RepID=UPI003399DB80